MGTGLAKSTLQHALSSGTVALASKQHLFDPVLMLIIYISVTNCSGTDRRRAQRSAVCFGGSPCGYHCSWDPACPRTRSGCQLPAPQAVPLATGQLAACFFQPPHPLMGSQEGHLVLVSTCEAFALQGRCFQWWALLCDSAAFSFLASWFSS